MDYSMKMVKEIYKSQVYCVKNKTFINFALEKRRYITGTAAFASMGLTTQISSSILVGTNKYRRPITRNGVKISFLLQENAITSSNIPLLRILDALRLIKDIPATSPDDCVMNICKAINALSMEQKRELVELSLAYTPYVRALLGAIYENMELETETISKT